MYLITWETYLKRKQIKSFWWIWDKDNIWWILKEKTEEIDYFIQENDKIYIEEIKNKELPKFNKLDYEIEKAKKRIEKWSNKQHKETTKSETSILNKTEKDFLKLGEPIKIWHHSEKRHRKLINKVDRDIGQRVEAYKKAENANNKREYWEEKLQTLEDKKNWVYKNAKEKKEERIEKIKEQIKIWDICYYWWKKCTITKINKKTIRVNEFSFAIDIDFIEKFDFKK